MSESLTLPLNHFERHTLGYVLYCLKWHKEDNGGLSSDGMNYDDYGCDDIPALSLGVEEYAAFQRIKNLIIHGNKTGKEGQADE